MKHVTLLVLIALVSTAPLGAAADTADERAVMGTLEAMARATVRKDIPALEKIYHGDLSYAHSTGELQTKAQVLRVVRERTSESMSFADMKIHIIGRSTALARGIMLVRNQPVTAGSNVEPTAFGPARDARVGVLWVLVKGPGPLGWQVAGRQIFPAPKPPATAK